MLIIKRIMEKNEMQKEKMDEIMEEEFKYISKGQVGSPQQEFRMIYNMRRRKSLSRSTENNEQDRVKVLLDSIEDIKEWYPDFAPEYDEKYFGTA